MDRFLALVLAMRALQDERDESGDFDRWNILAEAEAAVDLELVYLVDMADRRGRLAQAQAAADDSDYLEVADEVK